MRLFIAPLLGWLVSRRRLVWAVVLAPLLVAVWVVHTLDDGQIDEAPTIVVEKPVLDFGDHRRPVHRAPVRRTARAYLAVFHDHTLPDPVWRERLAAHSTDSLARLNNTVPHSVVPRATVGAIRVRALSGGAATVDAWLSDGTRLRVALVRDVDRWRVAQAGPA